MRRFFNLFLLSILICNTIHAQSYDENRKVSEKIISDTTYYYGDSGECASMDMASNNGINNLLENIEKNYRTDALCDIGFEPYRKFVEQNAESLILADKKNHRCFYYIKRSYFRDEISFRKDKIISYINLGLNAESDYRVGDALRFYYWAQMLCQAHPNGAMLMYDYEESKQLIYKWLNGKIVELISSVCISPIEIETVDGELQVTLMASTTDGHTISNLRYLYNNGQKYCPNNFEDGKSLAIMKNLDTNKIIVKIDITYYSEAEHLDPEVFMVMTYLKESLAYSGTVKKVNLKGFKNAPNAKEDGNENNDAGEYSKTVKDVVNAIRNNDIASVREHFSDDGFVMLNELANYGNFAVIGTPNYEFLEYGEEIICRSIPMQFDFRGNVSFCHNVVFRIDKNTKKITSLAFKLTDKAEKDIISKSRWKRESKLALINFLEDYQTAYALKRIDYLGQIFSDDAVIIIGHVLKHHALQNGIEVNRPDEIEYIRKTKTEYLQSLGAAFKSREYINLRFTDTDITRAVGDANEIYGIQVRQEYYSSSYGDVGYLFLLVDFRGELPIIHVRAWQPNATDTENLVNIDWFSF